MPLLYCRYNNPHSCTYTEHMFVLFHLLFELIKISILICVYATLTVILFKVIGQRKPGTWYQRTSKKGFKLWLISGLIISIGLFMFMFTYWGDHGLGDYSRVPIPHFKALQQIDGSITYIENSNKEQVTIDSFIFDNRNLYAKVTDNSARM
jgi:hypothetical protein